jgi:RNA polymerase sigma-70 factor (ECF subfamily)
MDENAFLILLKSSDKNAFNQLVALHKKNVINICYRFFLSREDAEDISQEVFVEVYYSIKNFRGDSKLSTWIYRIAVTRSLDELKKRNRKKRISSIGKLLGIEQVVNLLSGNDRPDKKLEDAEALNSLMKALGKLPQKQRVALTLSKIEGYTNTQVAEIMQTSLTAVDSLIYRAKKELKKYLDNKSPE